MDKSRFKTLLGRAGINQKQLSGLLDISEPTIAVWNKDNSYPAWLEDYLTGQICKNKMLDMKSFLDDIQ